MNADRAHPAAGAAPPGAESLATLLEYWATRQGDAPALTYLDYSTSRRGVETVLSWRELDELADAVASWVRPRCRPGDRVAIMAEQSPYYVASFLGVIRAQLIAVPLYPPGRPRHDEYLAAAVTDCLPAMLLTGWNEVSSVDLFLEDECGLTGQRVVAVDAIPSPARRFSSEDPFDPDDIAYLQYSSRSPNIPAGVRLSHANVLANVRQAIDCYRFSRETVTVSWLPLSHCMGLALSVHAPIAAGLRTVLFDPSAFQEEPGRWLRALSANKRAFTAAPTSAYAYTAAETTRAERVTLCLDGVVALVDGNEPLLADSLAEFHTAFAECGLPRHAYQASYGIAEATVFVSAGRTRTEPEERTFDATAMAAGRMLPAAEGARGITLVSTGRPAGQQVRVVDSITHQVLGDGHVGEIWISGANVGHGYWGSLPDSRVSFGARLAHGDADAEGVAGRGWLRTGDLGAFVDGELFVAGRLEDMITMAGREHYPHEIERTVGRAHPLVRRHGAAAFMVPGEQGDLLVVLAERTRDRRTVPITTADVTTAIRSAVQTAHGLPVHDVWLVGPGELPRTPEGKVSRSASRDSYLAVGEPRSSAS